MTPSDSVRPGTFLVWGGGGHGRMVADLIRSIGREFAGYVDRDPRKLGEILDPCGGRVGYVEDQLLAELRETGRYPNGIAASALGIGDNRFREACLRQLDGLEVPPLVHPSATVSEATRLGRGTVVFPQALVNNGAQIGEAVIVNSGAIVEHDCVLDDAVHLSPGAILCGAVKVGERTWIGAGATIIHEVTIGRDVVVGAGATVLHDVAEGMTVVGTPARPVRTESRIGGREL